MGNFITARTGHPPHTLGWRAACALPFFFEIDDVIARDRLRKHVRAAARLDRPVDDKWQSERTLNGNMETVGPSRVTAVMQKRGDKWLIVQFHNSPTPKPLSATPRHCPSLRRPPPAPWLLCHTLDGIERCYTDVVSIHRTRVLSD